MYESSSIKDVTELGVNVWEVRTQLREIANTVNRVNAVVMDGTGKETDPVRHSHQSIRSCNSEKCTMSPFFEIQSALPLSERR